MTTPEFFAALLLCLCACGNEESKVAPALMDPANWHESLAAAYKQQADPVAGAAGAFPQGIVDAQRALERGDGKTAYVLLEQHGDDEGWQARTLRARLFAMRGDDVGAVRELEGAKLAFPERAEVYATGAEIHAAARRTLSAAEELKQGLQRCGPQAPLRRAKAALLLCHGGKAQEALIELDLARKSDPQLPFCAPLVAQAHLLLGNRAQTAKQPQAALEHARLALEANPQLPDAKQLMADVQASLGQFAKALEIYEELIQTDAGRKPQAAILYHRAATADVVQKEHDLALARYLRARELGLSDEALGHGATVLERRMQACLEQGIAAFERDDWAAAGALFEEACRIEPNRIQAHNHLAAAHFKQQQYEPAAREWAQVLKLAREQKFELPEPVELNLARALHALGRRRSIRALLGGKLEQDPNWKWAEEAREMLNRLKSDESSLEHHKHREHHEHHERPPRGERSPAGPGSDKLH